MAAIAGPPRRTRVSRNSRTLLPLGYRCLVALLAATGGLAGVSTTAAAPQPARIDLIKDLPGAGDLAAPANGQTLYILDESRGDVVAIDPFEPARRWTAVATPDASTEAVAIGCIDTSMLAILCRKTDAWSLQTHRLQPGTAADPGKPGQTVPISVPARAGDETPAAAKPAGDGRPCLMVSPSRDWLAVCGLPAPLPAVVRGPIAGARIGSLSMRACPTLAAGLRPAAAAISPADEFILFTAAPANLGKQAFLFRFTCPQTHGNCCTSTRRCRASATPPSAAQTARCGSSAGPRGALGPPPLSQKDCGGSTPCCRMAGSRRGPCAWPASMRHGPWPAFPSGRSS